MRWTALIVLFVACTPTADDPGNDPPDPPCHDGGDGACVALDACSEGFALDGAGRCARWRFVGTLARPHTRSTATLLSDGRVLVVGGVNAALDPVSDSAIFDPATEAWRAVPAPRFARSEHLAFALAEDRKSVV